MIRYSVNFNLNISDKKGNHYIFLRVRFAGKELKLNIGLKVQKKDWDKHKQMLKVNTVNYFEYKKLLERIRDFATNELLIYINNSKFPDFSELKQKIKSNFIIKEKQQEKTFFEYFEEFFNYHKPDWKHSTIKNYKVFKKHLQALESDQNIILNFENINNEFYYKFKEYFFDTIGILNSTVLGNFKKLKTFMKWANDKGYTNNMSYLNFKFNYSIESTIIYLTSKEREELFYFDLSENKRLERIRDVFILGCYTGLRFYDLYLLKPANIINNTISFIAHKTTTPQVIPLNQFAETIVKKYIDKPKFLNVVSNQKLNDYLKELGKLLNINIPTQKIQFKRKERIETYEPKFKFMTSHTARRTFGTLYLQDGGNINHLQKLFGHKEIKTTMRYLGVNAQDLKDDMQKVFKTDKKSVI